MAKADTKKEMENLEVLEALTKAYARISSSRIKKTRDGVLTNRDFLDMLDKIFNQVRVSYKRKVMNLAKKSKEGKITFIPHNGRTVAVYLSANTGLYGDLPKKVFLDFAKEVKEKNLEATIIGKVGLSLYLEEFPKRPYTYFDLPDYGIDKKNMAKIVEHLVPYEAIHVFYGKFRSIVMQEPALIDISAETSLNAKSDDEGVEKIRYLFEPTMEEILMFFEEQMFTSLFEQAVRESQLAKFASRMLSMDKAGENIRKNIKKEKLNLVRLSHLEENRKQLNAMPSIFISERSLWGK